MNKPVAVGCAAAAGILMVMTCGLSALLRQYREITVPLSLVFLVLAIFFGRDAWASRRR